MILTTVNVSIEVLLSGAVTTNQLQVTADWLDLPSANFESGRTTTVTAGATPVTLVPACQDNKRREVKSISIYNADTVAQTVTIRYNVSTVYTTIVKVTLGIGFALYYTGTNWFVLNASGQIVTSVVASTVVPDGVYGDVTVSGSGATWTVLSASETQAGKIEIATQVEYNTGTDDTRAVTALKSKVGNDLRYQPLDSDLTAIASLTTTAYGRGLLTLANAAAADWLSKANNLSDVANTGTARTNLGLAIGTDVQAYSAVLADLVNRWVAASASGAATLAFLEDADNGTNKVTLKAAESLASDYVSTLPSSTGTLLNNNDVPTQIVASTPADPTGTASATVVMMGLAIAFTPATGTRAVVTITGTVRTASVAASMSIIGKYGTGTAPTNGAAVTGTSIGAQQTPTTSPATTARQCFSISYVITGLSVGTAYWIDLGLATSAGTLTATGLSVMIQER